MHPKNQKDQKDQNDQKNQNNKSNKKNNDNSNRINLSIPNNLPKRSNVKGLQSAYLPKINPFLIDQYSLFSNPRQRVSMQNEYKKRQEQQEHEERLKMLREDEELQIAINESLTTNIPTQKNSIEDANMQYNEDIELQRAMEESITSIELENIINNNEHLIIDEDDVEMQNDKYSDNIDLQNAINLSIQDENNNNRRKIIQLQNEEYKKSLAEDEKKMLKEVKNIDIKNVPDSQHSMDVKVDQCASQEEQIKDKPKETPNNIKKITINDGDNIVSKNTVIITFRFCNDCKITTHFLRDDKVNVLYKYLEKNMYKVHLTYDKDKCYIYTFPKILLKDKEKTLIQENLYPRVILYVE